MLINSIGLFGAGTVDFSGTGSVEFDLSFLPAGAFLASESGFIILPGDFNGDGKVDGEDFLLWQRDPGIGSLAEWEANYGMVAPLTAASAAIPEPTTCTLALVP